MALFPTPSTNSLDALITEDHLHDLTNDAVDKLISTNQTTHTPQAKSTGDSDGCLKVREHFKMVEPCWKKEKHPEEERKIKANNSEYNKAFNYANNHIKTSKYNILTFFPLNLFEQFQRLANFYFLCLLILQLIPQISSLTPVTTIVPLVCVLALTALKDGVDDIQRHRNDNQVNNRISHVLRNQEMINERWHKVQVGDIIRMENDHFVAADLLLLSTSEPHGLCYIETAELDGETNLKCRQAIPETAELGEDVVQMGQFNGEITCEAPNNNLNKFEGMLLWKEQSFALDNDKMLLRGCVLRNTKWCYGLVIFAGRDTKLMQNSGKAKLKRTSIDRLLNILIIGIVMALITVCMFCTIACGFWETLTGQYFRLYLEWDPIIPQSNNTAGSITVISLLVFFSYAIVLNTVVPISLYVSVEIIRFGHSWWINWDEKMIYKKSGTAAKSRTTTLNEELGQVEYIFSDKTGTLTQNIMTFNKCSINKFAYGDIVDKDGHTMELTEETPKLDFSWNPLYEANFRFFDPLLVENVRHGNREVEKFFRLLALCHTVMVEEKDGQLDYQAQSPDEAALVSAARNFGFVFRSRTPTTITIEVHGKQEVYELLCILDFNNVRKRMSVILRHDNKIKLLCKGADSVIYSLLEKNNVEVQEATTEHLNRFASEGLRTLCLAEKDIPPKFFEEWKKKHHVASTSLEDRQEKLDNIYEQIEQNMTLIGATAIEDKLQEGVPDTIANLAIADIKLWVLTGDKQETAINIGYSCKLLADDMHDIFIVDESTYETVERQLIDIRNKIRSVLSREGSTSVHFRNTVTDHHDLDEDMSGFALVINGHSLVHALHPGLEKLLLEVGCDCRSIICCRVTPLQKALVVELVKKYKKAVTLAIGDGANDVSMIKAAHIGVGISGQEGLQAVLASDFSIAQFRYLERLLLVHGRWSYLRMCKFLQYFFYKNFAFTLCHFWYGFFCGFSAQTLFDPWFISFYNLFYTALPVLALGVFDQDVNDLNSLKNPKLYIPGHQSVLFNKLIFLRSVAHGIATSLVLFFIPYGAFYDAIRASGLDMNGLQPLGVAVATILVIVVTFQIALDTSFYTFVNFFVIFGSILFYFGMTFFMYSDVIRANYVGVAESVLSTAPFWFTLILTVAILMVPVIAVRFYCIDTRPSLSDRLRIKQQMTRIKSRPSQLTLRPRSSLRQSRRSLRSGYAFAHQEGFGELITTGANMRLPNHSPNLLRFTKSSGSEIRHTRSSKLNVQPANENSSSDLDVSTKD